jgi:metal-sulfur cluster biosynthetic enzyme
MATVEEVYSELRQVYDPEIPVNIVDLGLVYDVKLEGTACNVTMTLTSQSCPEAATIPEVVKRRVVEMEGVDGCNVEVVWQPQWTPQRISEQGRAILGIEDPPEEPAEGGA